MSARRRFDSLADRAAGLRSLHALRAIREELLADFRRGERDVGKVALEVPCYLPDHHALGFGTKFGECLFKQPPHPNARVGRWTVACLYILMEHEFPAQSELAARTAAD